jgi:tRNA pseudouridine55 synthase
MLTEKAYDATVRLGVATTTDDAEGEPTVAVATSGLDEATVRAAAATFVGRLEQVPSAVSAIKVDGRRAHARVRAGEDVELAPRSVTVHELVVHDVRLGDAVVDLDIGVRCSSGTYIRAIARDLGGALGVGGHLTALRRTAVGPYDLGLARTLDQLGEEFEVMPIAAAARTGFDSVDLTEEQAADVRFGRALDLALPGLTAVFDPSGEFLALYEPRDGLARAVAVFV